MKKFFIATAFMFSLGLFAPQSAFAIDPPTHPSTWQHIHTIDGRFYKDVFGKQFEIVWITYRDGTQATVVYDSDGNLFNTLSGHVTG